MNKKEKILEILESKEKRLYLFSKSFYYFFIYYFSRHIKYPRLAPFHKEWIKSAEQGYNLYVEGHRESGKTTILGMAFEIRKICFEKCDFICNLCYDKNKARAFNKMIAIELLQNRKIINDFGMLFAKKKSNIEEDDLLERGINEFVTTNYIKVKAFGMGEPIRGEVYNSRKKGNVRPDHLNCQPFGNLVLTTKGEKNVSKIVAGDFVYTANGKYGKVLTNWETKELPIYKIKIHGYNELFSFSEGHLIYSKHTKNKYNYHYREYDKIKANFNKVEDIKKGSYIGFPINITEKRYGWEIWEKKKIVVKRNKKGQITKGGYIRKEKKMFLEKQDYYILGQFFGDGSLGQGGIIISCDYNKPQIIEKIIEKSRFKVNTNHKKNNVVRVLISSVFIYRVCEQIKIKNKNSWKLMPYGFEEDLIENQIEFIKGYIDSDGYVDYKNNCIRITSVNLSGLRQVQRILLRMGITSSIRDGIDSNENYEIMGYRCKTQKKYDLYMRQGVEILGYGVYSQARYKYTSLKNHIFDGYLWSSVKEIRREEKKEKCFAFSVEGDRSYCNHLIANHNCDDIDNNKNTRNINIIKNDMDFLFTEIFGGLDKDKHQIICLGNVIRKDGRNPRIKNTFKKNENWKIHSNFIYGKAGTSNGEIQWSRFVEKETDIIKAGQISLEKIKLQEKSGYFQNWLGIPLLVGQTIVKEEWIIYNTELTEFDYFQIGIDPAFSKKTNSDAFGIVVTGHKKIKNDIYKKAVFCKKLEGAKKDTGTAINIIKSLYNKYNAKIINIEGNGGGDIFGELLKKENLAVNIIKASKDKVTRLKEHEGDLMRGLIYFSNEVEELVSELLEFTGEEGGEDNLVDAFVYSLVSKNREFFTL